MWAVWGGCLEDLRFHGVGRVLDMCEAEGRTVQI